MLASQSTKMAHVAKGNPRCDAESDPPFQRITTSMACSRWRKKAEHQEGFMLFITMFVELSKSDNIPNIVIELLP
jgi:hypothetical protein